MNMELKAFGDFVYQTGNTGKIVRVRAGLEPKPEPIVPVVNVLRESVPEPQTFVGAIDDLRVYDVARPAEQIQAEHERLAAQPQAVKTPTGWEFV